jgi:hypothetical protein
MHMLNDDFVETDGSVHNVRVFNNRGVNAFHGGYSSQPVFGGPVYFIRNLLYNVQSGVAFKLDAKPAGLFMYHNTIIGEQAVRSPTSNVHWRNNLIMGRDTPNRGVMVWANMTGNYSSDYNGYRPNKGVAAQFTWMSPEPGATIFEAGAGNFKNYGTLAEFQSATGQEKHAREVDFDIFENMTPPNPATRHAVYHSMDLNFRLKPGANAVDGGVALPTVNDDFTGNGPDLGALELGKPEPHYGPRWITWKPFYR